MTQIERILTDKIIFKISVNPYYPRNPCAKK